MKHSFILFIQSSIHKQKIPDVPDFVHLHPLTISNIRMNILVLKKIYAYMGETMEARECTFSGMV